MKPRELNLTEHVKKDDLTADGYFIRDNQPGLIHRRYSTVKAFQKVYRVNETRERKT